ncbi:hypothetical protein NQZ68_028586 [Dissostichus eleginoides]|nr:hypothetical protein NQZ68_028586 [Dissostichus eleginoides]
MALPSPEWNQSDHDPPLLLEQKRETPPPLHPDPPPQGKMEGFLLPGGSNPGSRPSEGPLRPSGGRGKVLQQIEEGM